MVETIDDITENFELFDDWEDRYRYLLELGDKLPPMEDALKNEQTSVKGCTSRVWLYGQSYKTDNSEEKFTFKADSDAKLVRGLIYILYAAYNDLALQKVKELDIDVYFDRLGLSTHLTPNRRNGFFAMVGRIQSYASGDLVS